MRSQYWPEVPVLELQAPKRWALNGGPFGSKLVSRDYIEAGVPVIRGANLPNDRRFNIEDFVFVSEEKADELLANNAHPGDVVFTQRGTLGQVGIIPKQSQYQRFVISQSQMKISVDEKRVDPDWLFYCFRNPTTQQEMINRASTSGVPHINLGVLREFKVRLPSLPEQRRIASILAAYDDLIENNTRRIAILEEMSKRIYEEWFVRFRFPGHENVRMIESELGMAPEGWRQLAVRDVAVVHRGRSYKGSELADEGGRPFINLKCMERDGGYRSSGLKRYTGIFKDSQSVRSGEMVMAITDMTQERRIVARVGRVARLDSDFGIFSMDLVRLATRGEFPESYLYAMFRWSGFADEVKQHANGANVLHLLPSRIEEYRFICPPARIATHFGVIHDSILSLHDTLTQKNENLRVARDLLLPKLISGELDVSALPELEAVAA
jgi:type I restriction enzyme, S subunit